MIASDGGLLSEPFETDLDPAVAGERAEILVRMAPGESAVLQSIDPELGGVIGFIGNMGGSDKFDVLELRAAPTLESRGTVPDAQAFHEHSPIERIDPATASAERTFTLDGTQINQREMDMNRIDEVVTLGTTEVWNG